jgi:hypothetical protein
MTRGSIASKWVEENDVGKVINPDPHSLAQAIIEELRSKSGEKSNKTIKILAWREAACRLLDILWQISG